MFNLPKDILKLAASTAIAGLLTTNIAFADKDGLHEKEHESKFAFALWGDMPYVKNNDSATVAALINDINANKLAFTVYDGDTKDGSSVCDDDTIGAKAAEFFNQLKAPTVYVPGDNEWTDCHRKNNGGYDALERLSYLRQHMFNTNVSFGQNQMPVQRQGAPGEPYSENTRWMRGGVVFVGLNVPGSNNNYVPDGTCLSSKSVRTQVQCDADNLEYAERNARNLDWVKESFAMAKQQSAAGVMLVMQGDPGFDWPETEDVNERDLPGFEGYTDLLNTLVEESQAYSGQVVLVHGDTHYFKIDKPLVTPGNMINNFTRVETFGSPNIHWIKVLVNAKSKNVFTFHPMIVSGN